MKKILFSCCVLSIAFMYSVGFCTYPEESSETDSSSGNSLFTKYKDDLLSADIKDVPLGDVLQKLSDETGILFSFPPSIGEESVMVRFSNFTIPEALNKILASHDRIFIYEETQPDADESLPGRLKEVRVYTPLPPGTSRGTAPEQATVTSTKNTPPTKKTAKTNTVRRATGKRPPAKKQTVASLGDDLKDSDYNVRIDAIRNLRNVGNADAIGHLTSALEDKNPQVSEAAKNALQELQDERTDQDLDPDYETEDTQSRDGTPAYGIELVSQNSEDVELKFNLSDVPDKLITAGLWIEYDPSQMSIVSADIHKGDDAWDEKMCQTIPNPKGPGTYMMTAGNLNSLKPDNDGTIEFANVIIKCPSGNCSFTVGPGPDSGFDAVVGDGGDVFDSKMQTITYTIP
jgi:hypothetical protein